MIIAKDWAGLAQRLEPVLDMSDDRSCPRRPSTARTCPRSSPSARSPTGAAPSASRARWTRRSTSSSTTTGSGSTVEGIEHVPATGGALLVSNHAGALPPDAAMIAKAIKTEHPRPRPLHLTVEHFFKGYPGLSMLVSKLGGVPAHPANVHRLLDDEEQLVLVFPEGRKGTEKLYKDRYRLRRFGRGGFVESAMRAQGADRPRRGRRRRGGDAGLRPRQAAQEAHRPDLLPDHAAVPVARPRRAPPTCRRSSTSASWSRSRPTSGARSPWDDKGLVQTVAEEVRARIQEELYEMLADRKSVWLG